MCIKMSDVRLSNASPTLERVDARQPDNMRPPVRRNLFGRPDREEIRRNLATAVQEDVEAFRERYNFDPVEERPLEPRNFEWQEDPSAPEFYLRPPHGSQPPRREVELPGGDLRQERSETRPENQAATERPRKRRSGDSGPCSSECHSKRSHTDEEDDEDDPSHGAASQAVKAAEQRRPDRPESSEDVQ
ncbi:cyclin-dependent kinase inhibitor 1Ba [Hippoglossus hippoglossus]|uniref:cyclin-dependent kinase inhibitor 1Ba n=1 Tax=Hippoglossus hippoglossus TaxID=8267 RepID=UPI00148B89CB|nr:cyclin-dependent kinase inhibitor 1Ba [Hippoglossus hippoglossus]XP_035003779.1 cyclin-dependent kinase inhibitor 1Ba [Hippoglossus stenolepis]